MADSEIHEEWYNQGRSNKEELPTVFKEVRCPECKESRIRGANQKYFGTCKRQVSNGETYEECGVSLETVDELVRRKDAVKKQIEMLNQIDEAIRDAIETTDRDVPYFVYDQIKKHRQRLQSQLNTEQENGEGGAE